MNSVSDLHDRDFNLWIEQVKTTLYKRDLSNMDWDNLLEEIDDMGKSEKRSLESYLERLVEHILKLKYWHQDRDRNYKHWQVEVVNFRNRIKRLLKRSPSLKKYLQEIYLEVYQDVADSQKIEFDIPEDDLIELEKMMEKDYFA